MSKFLFIQILIKLFVVAQNLWYTRILDSANVSNLFLVLSSVVALNLILDFNSSIEINRANADDEKVFLVKSYLFVKGLVGFIAALLLFVYFRIYLEIDVLTSMVCFILPFDALIALMMTKFLSLHEIKLYHFFTILVSTLKILLPVLTFFLLESVSIGVLAASVLSCILIVRNIELRVGLSNLMPLHILLRSFGVGVMLNLVQRIDLFLISATEVSWRDSFYVYNRFYEFGLFPISLIIGFKFRELNQSKEGIKYFQNYQVLGFLVITISAYILSIYLDERIIFIFGIKYSLVLLGMYLFPVYSKSVLYSRNTLLILLSIILLVRLTVERIFDFGIYLLLCTEMLLFLCLVIVAIPAINKNRFVNA